MKGLLQLLLVGSVLLPFLRLEGDLPSLRFEFILVPIAAIPLLILSRSRVRGGARLLPQRSSVPWMVLFALAMAVSLAWGSAVLGSETAFRDLFEVLKIGIYIVFFLIGSAYGSAATDVTQLERIFRFTALLSLLIGFVQLVNPLDFNSVVTAYYAPTQGLGLSRYGRITGTFTNPNDFGSFLILPASLALAGAMWAPSRKRRLWMWSCFLLFSIGIALTLSRSSMVGLAIAVAYLVLALARSGSRSSRLIRVVCLLAAAGFLVFLFAPSTFVPAMKDIFQVSSASSWLGRLEKWKPAITAWKASPFFGWGPAKSAMATVVDSEWILLLRRYGAIGVAAFLLWTGAVFMNLGTGMRSAASRVLSAGLRATALAWVPVMVVGGIYGNEQLMAVVMLLAGAAESFGRAQLRRRWE